MAFRIEENFHVDAPQDTVWRWLIDPRQVVQCLPGAELTEAQDDRTFLGRVKVKVGPVVAAYNGKATLADVDDAAHRVRITAEGRETQGAGSARMTMTSDVVASPAGGSDVRVEAELDIAGKIVQFGRGMIETVNKQLFRQFVDCAKARLEAPASSARPESTAAPVESASAIGDRPPSTGAPVERPGSSPAAMASPVPPVPPAAADATRVAEPVRILPLIFRALWQSLARLFGRRRAT